MPRYSKRTVSLSAAALKNGSKNVSAATSSRRSVGHPARSRSASNRGRKHRCEMSSSHAYANPGARDG